MAARNLAEGLEEILTMQRLGINHVLYSLSTTNIIENCFSQAANWTRRVKKWSGPEMVLRWSTGAFLWAEKTFKRIDGCKQIKDLVAALRNSTINLKLPKCIPRTISIPTAAGTSPPATIVQRQPAGTQRNGIEQDGTISRFVRRSTTLYQGLTTTLLQVVRFFGIRISFGRHSHFGLALELGASLGFGFWYLEF